MNANQVKLAATREVTFGVTPTSGVEGATPVLQELRFTSEDLSRRTAWTRSQELRADRQVADMIRTDVSVSGSISHEQSFGGTTFSVVSGNIYCTASGSKITGESGAFTGVTAGQWVRFNRSGSANNGYWFVTAVSVGDDELTVVGEGTATISNEDPGSPAEVAVDSWADNEWAAALQSDGWTVGWTEAVTGLFQTVGGSDAIGRTTVSDSATGVFSVNASAQYERTTGNWNTSWKVGMRVLVAGFANPENNGLKTITAIPTNTTLEVSDTLTTEATPAGAVSFTSNWSVLGYSAGQIIKVSGFAATSANTFHVIEQVTASNLVVYTNLGTESVPAGEVTIEVLPQISNGIHQSSFSVECSHSDSTSIFDVFSGVSVDRKSLRIATASVNGGSVSVLGKVDDGNTVTVGTGTNDSAPAFDVMNAIDNVEEVRENHVTFGTVLREFSIEVGNNLFPRTAITELGATSIGSGSIEASGSMTVYFESASMLNKHRNWTTTSFMFVLVDSDSNYYVVNLPSVKLTEARKVTPGLNQDVTATFTWTAFRDASLLETIRVARLQA